jgi:cytochrome c-type biogenesis protein CcmH
VAAGRRARGGRSGPALGLALALLALAASAPAEAPSPAPGGWSYALWNELMSPFCPGRTLADCPSGQAESLRLWILVQESAGRSREDVEAELLERYGEVVLSAPRARGIGVAAYAIPVLAFLAGGALWWLFLRRQTRRAALAPAPVSAAPLDPELELRLDRELGVR